MTYRVISFLLLASLVLGCSEEDVTPNEPVTGFVYEAEVVGPFGHCSKVWRVEITNSTNFEPYPRGGAPALETEGQTLIVADFPLEPGSSVSFLLSSGGSDLAVICNTLIGPPRIFIASQPD